MNVVIMTSMVHDYVGREEISQIYSLELLIKSFIIFLLKGKKYESLAELRIF